MSKPGQITCGLIGALVLGACGRAEIAAPSAANTGGVTDAAGLASNAAGTGDSRVETAGKGGSGGSHAQAAASGRGGAGASAADGGGGGKGSGVTAGSGQAGSAGRSTAGANGAAAGSFGAAGGMSTAPSGASLCSDPGLLFCESFESETIDKSVWQTMTSAPALDSARAARGSKSLHVHTNAVGASGLQTSKFLARTQGHYYGRLFVWFDALPTSPAWAHWTIIGASAASNATDQSEIRVGGQADGKLLERWGVGTDHGPSGDWTNLDDDPKGAAPAIQLGQWQCIEWLHDWANDETRFYLNGVEHMSLHTTRDVKHADGGKGTAPYDIPDLASVWVGFWNYDQGDQGKRVMPKEFNVWIDEVAFDDERIGCEK